MTRIGCGSFSLTTTRETTFSMSRPHLTMRLLAVLLTLAALMLAGSIASAQAAAPALTISMDHSPSTFQRMDQRDSYLVTVTNSGDAASDGSESVSLTLPAALKFRGSLSGGNSFSCVDPTAGEAAAGGPFRCTNTGSLAPGDSTVAMVVPFVVSKDAPDTVTATATVSGGGAVVGASVSDPTPVVDRPVFAIQDFTARALDENGNDYTVAGGHPYEAKASFSFPSYSDLSLRSPVEDVKDAFTDLPPGFVGSAAAAPRCELTRLQSYYPSCPPGSKVGEILLGLSGNSAFPNPVYNMVPERGFPAEFAFKVNTSTVVMYPRLRSRTGEYGLTVAVPGASRLQLTSIGLTFFGVPSERNGVGGAAVPFLTNPSDCLTAQPATRIVVDSWQHPADQLDDGFPDLRDSRWKTATSPAPPVTGCDDPLLVSQFAPTITATPTPGTGSTAADTPSGYKVDLAFPQTNDPTDSTTVFDPSVPQAPQLKDATVTLPAGVAISPSAADGLDGCSDVPGNDQVRLDVTVPVTCPDASKIGTAVATSPLLAAHDPDTDAITGAEPINGAIYLVKPHPGDLSPAGDQDGRFRILIQLESEDDGINAKLPGIVTADKATGQLTARFTNNPELPVKTLSLTFKGGARAPLVNPPTCTSSATTTGIFSSWAQGGTRSDGLAVLGTPAVTATSSFAVDQGANGAPCASSVADLPFNPGFSAGVTNRQAGGSSPFVLRFTRQDGEQDLGSIDASLPPGLLGNIGAVPLCPEDQAAAGTCDSASQVGTTTVGAGAGPSPLFLPQAGKDPTAVYLAGPYKGAPFSLSIIVPAQAGPFDLGTVVVRAALFVDRHDAHVTVKSDPLPTIRDGVPLRVRDVRVAIDRPGFMLSPTNCSQQAVTGTIRSAQGKSVDVSSPFAVTGCDALPFNPQFAASTRGKLKFKQGAPFKVHIAVPAGDANIKSVATTLPKELPSRLIPTINNACVYDVFQADYNQCPSDSFVGTVTAKTPILDQPLTGPVYIVAPPNDVPRLEIVLLGQGKAAGVRVDLEGDVIVDSGGGRSKVTFATVPDVPVTSFDLDLPAGPHSILDAPSNDLCKGPITLGLSVIGQNGKRSDSNPTIKVSDCPKIAGPKVVSAKTTGTGVKLRVLAPAEGRLVVNGASLTTVARTVNRKLTYSVSVPLTAKAKKALAKKGKLRTRLEVYFKPVNARKATTVKTKTLTVKKAKQKTKR